MDKKQLYFFNKNLSKNRCSNHNNETYDNGVDTESAENASKAAWVAATNSIEESIKDEIWNIIKSTIKNDNPIHVNSKHNYRFFPISKFVASLAILLCVTATTYLLYNNFCNNNEKSIYSFEVEAGQKGSITLADGTLVHLNSLSKISFSSDYNDENRIVILDGEAYFEVAKNPDKKFIVSCNGIEIEALGTAFNVKAYPSDSLITTTLAQGKVKVSSREQSFTLNPYDVATYNVNLRVMSSSKIDDISIADYWRSKKLVFASEPLSSIAKTIERMYGVKIDIKDSELESMKFTGTIQNNSLNIVMDVISLSYPLTYTISDSTITIKSKHNAIK